MTVRRTVARPAHPHPDARASAQGRPEARRPSWATPAAKQLRITRAPHLHDAQELFSECGAAPGCTGVEMLQSTIRARCTIIQPAEGVERRLGARDVARQCRGEQLVA